MVEEVGEDEDEDDDDEEEGRVLCLPREPFPPLPPALPTREEVVGGDGEGERVGVMALSSSLLLLLLLVRLSPDPEEEPPGELGWGRTGGSVPVASKSHRSVAL